MTYQATSQRELPKGQSVHDLFLFRPAERQAIAYYTISRYKSTKKKDESASNSASFQRQVVTIDCTPDHGVVSSLFGSDSHTI
jgi:hypothetical protein